MVMKKKEEARCETTFQSLTGTRLYVFQSLTGKLKNTFEEGKNMKNKILLQSCKGNGRSINTTQFVFGFCCLICKSCLQCDSPPFGGEIKASFTILREKHGVSLKPDSLLEAIQRTCHNTP